MASGRYNGIEAVSQRGPFGQGPLARAWAGLLEIPTYESILRRAGNSARNRQVGEIFIGTGAIIATVFETNYLYSVALHLPVLAPDAWQPFFTALRTLPKLRNQLLAGQAPPAALALAQELGIDLLPPSFAVVSTACSCYAGEDPCRHVAAVWLLVAEELDRDPLRLFHLRGTARGTLYAALAGPEAVQDGGLPDDPAAFWLGDLATLIDPAFREMLLEPPAPPEFSVAAHLGPPAFWSGRYPFAIIERMATAISETANAMFYQPSDSPPPDAGERGVVPDDLLTDADGEERSAIFILDPYERDGLSPLPPYGGNILPFGRPRNR